MQVNFGGSKLSNAPLMDHSDHSQYVILAVAKNLNSARGANLLLSVVIDRGCLPISIVILSAKKNPSRTQDGAENLHGVCPGRDFSAASLSKNDESEEFRVANE